MERNAAFDGLRALAVIAVVAVHSGLPAVPGGFIGVDVFFVLSGYLITALLTGEFELSGKIDIFQFCVRRAMRLVPPLAVFLLAYLALAPSAWPEIPSVFHVRDALLSGLYLTDISVALVGAPRMLGHTWSLSLEQHFYLIWPLVITVLYRLGTFRDRFRKMVTLYLILTFWRILHVQAGSEWAAVYYRFDTNFSGLLLGGAIALLAGAGISIRREAADALAISALVVLLVGLHFWRWGDLSFLVWGQTVAELAAAALVLALAGEKGLVHRMLSARPVVFVGLISYSIYLWHYPMSRYFREWLEPVPTFAVVGIASLAVASASWFLIEEPLTRWRRRIPNAPTAEHFPAGQKNA